MRPPIVEKRIAGRTFFVTPTQIYEEFHPHELCRKAGIEFYLIARPSVGFTTPPFDSWRREKWKTVETERGVEFMSLDTTPLDDAQVAWVQKWLLE